MTLEETMQAERKLLNKENEDASNGYRLVKAFG